METQVIYELLVEASTAEEERAEDILRKLDHDSSHRMNYRSSIVAGNFDAGVRRTARRLFESTYEYAPLMLPSLLPLFALTYGDREPFPNNDGSPSAFRFDISEAFTILSESIK